MKAHNVTMLGTGLIGEFYTATLHGQRGRDHVRIVFFPARGAAWHRLGGAVGHAEKSSRPRPWDHGRRTGGPASVQKRRASAREERDTTRSSRFGGRRVPSA